MLLIALSEYATYHTESHYTQKKTVSLTTCETIATIAHKLLMLLVTGIYTAAVTAVASATLHTYMRIASATAATSDCCYQLLLLLLPVLQY
jgi:hypothetical protein